MATIKDVAKLAGVAPSTVSYALSGKRRVSEALRSRIDDAITRLDFTPSQLGHNLRTGISGAIGLAFPLHDALEGDLGMDFIATAADTIRDQYTLSLLSGNWDGGELVGQFKQNRIDGLILMQTSPEDARVDALRECNYPFSIIGRCNDTEGLSFVDFDFEEAVFLLVEHVVSLGHRQVGVLDFGNIPEQQLSYMQHTRRGLARALETFESTGLELHCVPSGNGGQAGYTATQTLLEQAPDLTAIVTLTGMTQVGALRALHDAGKHVPEDCSLVALGATRASHWILPRLTTVEIPLAEMGKLGASFVMDAINASQQGEQQQPVQHLLEPQVQIYESSCPPKPSSWLVGVTSSDHD
ncbi:MAG: LacI family DNA-binding transcriptional regulator [Deinococcota bacterium]